MPHNVLQSLHSLTAPVLSNCTSRLTLPIAALIMLHLLSGTHYVRQFSKAPLLQFSNLASETCLTWPFHTNSTTATAYEIVTL